MKMVRCLTHAAIVLACCGTLVPRAALAAGAAPAPNNDIALSAGGEFSGMLVNPEGQPVEGAVVSVRRGGQEVGRAVTTTQGTFQVSGLTGGVYELAAGQQVSAVRLWPANVAPPAARTQAVMVLGAAQRGQDPYCPPPSGGFGPSILGLDIITLWTLTASTGALVLAAINQSDLNDIQDKLDELSSN